MTTRDEPITEPLKVGDRVRVLADATVSHIPMPEGNAVWLAVDPVLLVVPVADVPSVLRRIVPDWTPHPPGTLLGDPSGCLWVINGNGRLLLVVASPGDALHEMLDQCHATSQWSVLYRPEYATEAVPGD